MSDANLPFTDHEKPLENEEYRKQTMHDFAYYWDALQEIQAHDMGLAGFQDHIQNELYFPTKLALVVTEIAEAIEAHRCGDGPDDHLPQHRGMDVEMADAVIRLMTLAAERDVNLGHIIRDKIEFNKRRPKRHGGKAY